MPERTGEMRTVDIQLFRDVFNTSPIGIAVETLEGQPLFVNPAFCSMLGFSEQELRSKHCVDFSPAEDAEKDWALFQRLREGSIDHYQLEKRYFRRDGSLIWGHLSISLLKNAPPLVVAMVEDITEKKKAEEALRASEERLRLAQQAARIGTFEWNIQTGVNTWTPELEEMYGLPLAGFGKTQTAFENLVHPDDRARVVELDDWALKTGQPTKGEWRVVWPDGSVHWIAGRWQVYMNESGQPARMAGVNIDITDQKRAEQGLATANERLNLAIESGSVGGWDYDLKTDENVWFGKALAQLGMTPDETSGSRKDFWDRVHKDDRQRLEHALQVAKEKREDFAEDVRVVWRDGTTHWLRSRGRFQYAASGEAERSLGISLDITERKMAEDKLLEYEKAVEGVEEMIAVIDRQYRFLIANRPFLKIRKMTKEQVVGRFVHEIMSEGFFEAVAKPKLDECLQGKVVRYETKYSYPEIGERDMFVSYFPVESGSDIDRVVCILQDITDRKRSEESLRESEQRLRLATQAGRMYAYDWDVLKDVVVRSSEHVKILGLTEPLRFPHQQFVDTIHLDDRATFLAAIAGLTPEHPTSEVTYRALTSDGALVWLKSNGRGFFDGEGRLQRVIGMVADVTDVKEAEEALASMTGKLIEAQEQERARIARELHDDITQRLTLLAIEFERLQNTPSEFPSRVQELRRQLTEMLSDVQSLSHELHSSKLDYLGMAAAIKGFCTELAEKHGVSIDFKDENTPKHLPKEIALCLFRVAQQALHNALKYSGMRHFEVEVSGTAEKVQLVVRDAGAGFDVEETKRRGGLGLVSMQERVNMLRGQFSVESRPGEGTKIVACVPLIAQVGRSSEGSGWKGAKAHSAGLT